MRKAFLQMKSLLPVPVSMCVQLFLFNMGKCQMCISKAHFPKFQCFYLQVTKIWWTLDLDEVLTVQEIGLRMRD